MAFLSLEDLFGTVEVIVFPGEYERYHTLLNEDEKVFIRGHANVEEDKNAKIICEQICTFAEAENGMPQEQRTYRQGRLRKRKKNSMPCFMIRMEKTRW